MLGLLDSARLLELLQMLTIQLVFIVVCIDFLAESGIFGTGFPDTAEVIGCSGDSIFISFSHNTFEGTCHRRQEISSRLAGGAIETKVYEVVFGFGTSAKVDLSAFVEHSDLVKDLIILAVLS